MNYPKDFNKLIEFYKSFPGVGEKNAERMAFFTYEMNDDKLKKFADTLVTIKETVKKCNICGNISDNETCSICSDESRDKNIICVVEDYKNIFSFEKNSTYKGTYHVIGGLISPIDNVNPYDLNIATLVTRVKNLENSEVIIALKSSIEGEMTMLYLKNILADYNVKVTRLSYGVPLGMNLDYMDVLSLNKALEDRREIDG